jgi:hypothetical protein
MDKYLLLLLGLVFLIIGYIARDINPRPKTILIYIIGIAMLIVAVYKLFHP